jgi:nucleotide-binding universal stress UspA family protein
MPQPAIHIGFGKPAVEIIRHAMAFGHDLVIKTAAGGTGISERLFGNTAIKLLRKCPSRVLIAKPDGPPALKRVLAAIDPMPASDRTVALNQHILRTAAQIARMEAGQLDIVHCWHLPGQSMLSFGRTKISAAELNQMRTMAEKLHRQKLTEFVDRMQLDGPSLKLHLLNGSPVESVLYFADRMKSDLVVIGTADKSALAGLLMGSTAESIIDKSKTSVLAVKPAGFISPITPGH